MLFRCPVVVVFLTAENMHEMPVKYSRSNRAHFQTELFERRKYMLCTLSLLEIQNGWNPRSMVSVCHLFIYLSHKPKFHGVLYLMERKGKLVFQAVAPIPCSHRFVSVQRGWILDGGRSTQQCSWEWGSKGLHQGQLPIPCLCLYPLVNSCIMYCVSNLIYQCLYGQTEGFISGSSKTQL